MLNDLLSAYQETLGDDYDRYRNHIRRVFLNCRLLDDDSANEEKYVIAAVFHDIGIWTHGTIDYLEPSIAETKDYLKNTGKTDWTEEIILMIDMHHKLTPYRGKFARTVEVFRKADWVDVSLGLLNFGINKEALSANRKRYQNLGFHWFLFKTIIKSFFKKPYRNPLPMFKK